MLRVTLLAVLVSMLVPGCGGPTREELLAQKEAQKFREVLDGYVQQYFNDHPQRATEAGMHDYDGFMPAFTRDHLIGHVDGLKRILNELAGLDTKRLPKDLYFDQMIFESKIRSEILDLSEIRSWMRNPNAYNDLVSNSILSLTDFHFASPDERLKSVISRLDQVPAILEAMQKNMESPAAISVEVAKEQFAITADFLKNDLAQAFAEAKDQELKDKLRASIEKASAAYEDSLKYLRNDLGRRARGGHSLGSKLFQQKLLYEELIETSVPDLARMAETELRRLQGEMAAAAARVGPGRSVAQALESMTAEYAKPEELPSIATALTADLKKFVAEKGLVSVPPDETPTVRALKPFAQGLLFAHLDSPGPLEKTTMSFYTITLPDPSWSASRKEQHLRLLNRSVLPILSIHETYPGHHVQFLHGRQASSKVRKLFGSEAFREGWASYAEQMMLDEGFGADDPKLRLAQLQFALLRAARFVTAVRIHGQGTMDEKGTVDFFVKEAYLSKENAEREARRVALDPTVLSYTLGKLEIQRLRDDYKKARGAAFSLKDFHDSLLKHGYPPVKILREILMEEASRPAS